MAQIALSALPAFTSIHITEAVDPAVRMATTLTLVLAPVSSVIPLASLAMGQAPPNV